MFYDVFEKLCTEKGVKPGRAADEIGISRATVTNWKKNGYNPRRNILIEIGLLAIFYVFGFALIGCISLMACATILAFRYFLLYYSIKLDQ